MSIRYALLASLACVIAAPSYAQNCTISWTAIAGGDWNTHTNWSAGRVPDGGDTACITADGTYTVTTTSADLAVSALIVGGTSGTQTLQLSRDISVNQTAQFGATAVLDWTTGYFNSGSITSSGIIRLPGPSNARGVRGSGTTLTSDGTVELIGSGSFYISDGATVTNAGTWVLSGDVNLRARNEGNTFRNTGTLRRAGEAKTQITDDGLFFENTGLIDVQEGELRIQVPSTYTNTAFAVASGALLRLQVNGARFEGTTTGDPAGTLRIDTHITAGDGAVWALGGTGITWLDGYLEEGGLRNTGLVQLSGTSNLRGVRGPGTTLTNDGTVELTGGGSFYISDGATVTNAGTWVLTGDVNLRSRNDGNTFRNTGTLRRDGDGVTQITSGDLAVENAGTITVHEGELRNTLPFTHMDGAVIQGEGTFFPGPTFTLAGGVSPGASPGILTWDGAYQPEATASLDIEIGGASPGEYDQLVVTGDAHVNGRLSVRLTSPYSPAVGTTFRVMEATTVSGEFSTLDLPDGMEAEVNADHVLVRVVSLVSAESPVSSIEGPQLTVRAIPNPTRGALTVEVATSTAGPVRVAVLDLLGREVAMLYDGHQVAGVHALGLDTSALATGVYLIRAEAQEAVDVRRLTVLR
ncbi:MAG: T9SS type A sorting domain-containing protein [Bacteroidota bacterium]